jgi:hypothetical protein
MRTTGCLWGGAKGSNDSIRVGEVARWKIARRANFSNDTSEVAKLRTLNVVAAPKPLRFGANYVTSAHPRVTVTRQADMAP